MAAMEFASLQILPVHMNGLKLQPFADPLVYAASTAVAAVQHAEGC